MFPFSGPPAVDDSVIRPLCDDDQRVLLQLVHKYGLKSLMCALTGLGESSRASAVSGTTIISAPSLVWTTASDGASIRTQSTGADIPIHESDLSRHQSWLESPCAITSPQQDNNNTTTINITSTHEASITCSSPRLRMSTLKKYQCPMCFLDNNLVEFGRKSDFKKHLNNFHGADVVWICRTRGCHSTFATERAYSTHAKEAHKMEALPSSAARTDLCPQLVFSCGFATCKDRIFEAGQKDDANASRDKYFEHIAKHFEDDYNVNEWDYSTQMHNLMRQQRVKSVWKTCIWPKERRTALSWRPRSSGDLKRMLECRHLGDDISQLVRLAFVLGTAPFTSSRTPPPSEIDLHFQLPFRSQCLLETDGPAKSSSTTSDGNSSGIGLPTLAVSKSRPNSMFRLPSRKGRASKTRPPTPPTSAPKMNHHVVQQVSASDMSAAGPHPGTPVSIPGHGGMADDGLRVKMEETKLVSENHQLQRQISTPTTSVSESQAMEVVHIHGSPAMYTMPIQNNTHDAFQPSFYTPTEHQAAIVNGLIHSPYQTPIPHHHHHDTASEYTTVSAPEASTTDNDNDILYNPAVAPIRPATPVPHKRPASWSRQSAMEDMRPKKKPNTPHGSPYGGADTSLDHLPMGLGMDGVPNAYGEMIPSLHHQSQQNQVTSVPQGEWALPMRMMGMGVGDVGEQAPPGGYHEPQQQYHHQHHPHHQHESGGSGMGGGAAPMTFFFDDAEGRM